MTAPSDEVVIGPWILLLDGVVLELLHEGGSSERFHVNHVRVDGKPKGRDLDVRIGVEVVDGMISNGAKIRVPEAQVSTVLALLERAKSRRTVPQDA